MRYTFKKAEHLTGKTAIENLFRQGNSFLIYPFRVFFNITEKGGEPPVRLLIGVSKKNFKHAVDRNRVKRLVREGYRKNKHILFSLLEAKGFHLHVGFIYLKNDIDTAGGIENTIIAALKKFETKLAEK